MPNDTAQKIAYNLVFDKLLKLNNESHKLDDEELLDAAFTFSAVITPLVSALEEIKATEQEYDPHEPNDFIRGITCGHNDNARLAAKALREVQP